MNLQSRIHHETYVLHACVAANLAYLKGKKQAVTSHFGITDQSGLTGVSNRLEFK